MAVNYDKLWRILNERGMMKTELIREAKISTNAMAKLGRNEDVRVGILEKICLALDCKMDDILDIVPERVWQYNHIVCYVVIGYEFGDISFKLYLPTPQKQRYMWRTSKKTFLYDVHSNGTHFRVNESMCNEDIQYEIADMLDSIIKEQVPKKYYVDRQAFDNINSKIDYLKIINEVDNKQI